jgi:hypothetical protein
MADVYQKLRKRLDDMATGYPETQSGIEIRILKRLFTEAEAELFLGLSPFLETPADAAKRLHRNPDEVADRMEQMAQKGLLFRRRNNDHGMNTLNKHLVKPSSPLRHPLCEQYPSIVNWWPNGRWPRTKIF